ncbi:MULTISPECIES: TorF family putative porin [Ramlibacter]|uniref:Porin n=1 Tax=Ramlibacter pinisoli TaxID=2682844 RepID=A0A6N8IMT0_9BURK|nr:MULTISPECIES: TorF family putative porin [Ramlibacter]MBA2960652.1 hypothetical protein [Ramlibacter sp. CGMCC 1.13660]MVQ27982.1 hypothetical protein [Ramlibacter pinisoli]
MNFKTTVLLSSLVLSGAAFAQTKAPEPDWTVTGNVTLASDYRFRGFTQTNYGPALQGGFDIAHKSGFYVGNWNSNVKDTLYNGASLEMDFYGGYKGEFSGVGYDLGAIYYYYPKSGKDTAATTGLGTKIDNKEIYAGLSYGPFSGKLYYAIDDYFQLATVTGEIGGTALSSTKGTTYLDLSYSQDFSGFIVGAHYGLLTLKNNGQFTLTSDVGGASLPKSVGDYKLSVGKDFSGYMFTAAVVGTSHKGYAGTDLSATKAAGKTGLVLSVGKTF